MITTSCRFYLAENKKYTVHRWISSICSNKFNTICWAICYWFKASVCCHMAFFELLYTFYVHSVTVHEVEVPIPVSRCELNNLCISDCHVHRSSFKRSPKVASSFLSSCGKAGNQGGSRIWNAINSCYCCYCNFLHFPTGLNRTLSGKLLCHLIWNQVFLLLRLIYSTASVFKNPAIGVHTVIVVYLPTVWDEKTNTF